MEGAPVEGTNGAMNGHAEGDDEDRPMKKLKADDGSAVALDADGMDDEDMGDDQDDILEDGDDQAADDYEDEGDDVVDEEDDVEEETHSQIVNAFVETPSDGETDDEVELGGMRDEALDDPGSESE